MIHKDFKGDSLPALGLGTMRLPVIGGKLADIEASEATAMIELCMEQGVNYFDTAWGYHDGNSEVVVGKALKRYPRKTFFLADKFPGYDLANMDRVEEIFEEQLRRCQVDCFDYYLFHNVCEMNIDAYLDERHGIFAYLTKQKEAGRIRHLGLSVHGSLEVTKRFLDAYGHAMEFCQVQLNYIDWEFQAAREKVELLAERGIPVWVMEPLRGGKLASLSAEDAAKLRALRPDETPVGWAFRFLQSIPEACIVLSGASSMEQLKENLRICSEERPLNQQEMDTLFGIAAGMVEQTALPCTSCNYCVSHCPQELDIPRLLALYNEHHFTGGGFLAPMALQAIPNEKHPTACIGCGACEAVCPQQIKISEALADFTAKLGAS